MQDPTYDAPGPSWLDMSRSDFDTGQPLTLFDVADMATATLPAKPDRYGTPDMFGGQVGGES